MITYSFSTLNRSFFNILIVIFVLGFWIGCASRR